jgi:hypothetical protein
MEKLDLVKAVMQTQDMTEAEAKEDIKEATQELKERCGNGEMPFDFCEERWGLEPDYLEFMIM